MHSSEVPTTAAVKGDMGSQQRMARHMGRFFLPSWIQHQHSCLLFLEILYFLLKTFEWGSSPFPGLSFWSLKGLAAGVESFPSAKLLLSLGEMPMVSWRRASRIWSWGPGSGCCCQFCCQWTAGSWKKNKEADIIYSEDNREKQFSN